MKNMTYNLTNKNLINLKKIDFINDANYVSKEKEKENKDSKRLLHIYLMKFIKTQFNKNKDILTKKEKCFPKYNNLNLLPYLKKKYNKKYSAKNTYFNSYSRINGLNFIKNHESKTNNNINEYSSKDKTFENNHAKKSFKDRDTKINTIKSNRLKSSFDWETSRMKNYFKIRADIKYKLNNILFNKESFANHNTMLFLKHKNSNFNIYNKNVPHIKRRNSSNSSHNASNNKENAENENNKNDSRKESIQKENSLNYKNKTNSFNSKISITKISNYLNELNYNTQFNIQNEELGKNNKGFELNKNENNDFHNNFTYREDNKDSNLILDTPNKKSLNHNINKNMEITENKSTDKNRIMNYIKSIYENRKNFASENKSHSSSKITNINIKKFKYNLKQAKNDYSNFYQNKYNKFDIINCFFDTKDGSKINKNEKNSKLIDSKKMEIINNLKITTKIGYKNKDNMKWIQPCPIGFNININNKKNNNNDIIDLI